MKVRTCGASFERQGEGLSWRRSLALSLCAVAASATSGAAQATLSSSVAAPAVPATRGPECEHVVDALGERVTWRHLAPGSTVVTRFVSVVAPGLVVDGPTLVATPDGTASVLVPVAILTRVGPVHLVAGVLDVAARLRVTRTDLGIAGAGATASPAPSSGSGPGGSSGGPGVCTYWPVAIGGWIVSAPNASYQDARIVAAAGVSLDPSPPESTVTTLWLAVNDESSGGVSNLKVLDFDPAALSPGYDNVLYDDAYTLASGHVVCLRLFDHEPTSSELGSGALLWDSN